MRIALFLLFFLLICSNISAQELKIKLTHISFFDKFNFSAINFNNADSTLVFLEEKGFDDFMKSNNNLIFIHNKKNQTFNNQYSNIPAYKPMHKIDNYRYLENKTNKECQFCGIFEGLLLGW